MLGGLFLVPLAVGALVLLLVVPDAQSDRVSGDVDRSAAAVRAELVDECRSLGLAARVAALSLSSDAANILRDLVRDYGIDYAAVIDGDGNAVARGRPAASGGGRIRRTCPRALQSWPATPPARSSRSGSLSSATRRARERPWWPSGSTASC